MHLFDGAHHVVDTFRAVMTKTATWANANHDQSAQILAKYSNLDPALFKTQMGVLGRDKAGRARGAFQVIPAVGTAEELLFKSPLQGLPGHG